MNFFKAILSKVKFLDSYNHGWGPAICFHNDELRPKYPFCLINVGRLKQVNLLLRLTQQSRPKALQLQCVDKLSADQMRLVPGILFADESMLASSTPFCMHFLKIWRLCVCVVGMNARTFWKRSASVSLEKS